MRASEYPLVRSNLTGVSRKPHSGLSFKVFNPGLGTEVEDGWTKPPLLPRSVCRFWKLPEALMWLLLIKFPPEANDISVRFPPMGGAKVRLC